MDIGEVELSDRFDGISSNTLCAQLKLIDNGRTCTHTHTCNPPGPDSNHTHTCHHSHTQIFPSEADDHASSKPEKPSGNRAAVRKYREKKKAQTAHLEEEVKKLRVVNQKLMKKLQGQAALEEEAVRLRGLLLDLKVKIDEEIDVPPFHKQKCNGSMVVQCGNDIPWFPIDLLQDHRCDGDCQAPTMNNLGQQQVKSPRIKR